VAAWSPATAPLPSLNSKYTTKAEEYTAAEGCNAGARKDSQCNYETPDNSLSTMPYINATIANIEQNQPATTGIQTTTKNYPATTGYGS